MKDVSETTCGLQPAFPGAALSQEPSPSSGEADAESRRRAAIIHERRRRVLLRKGARMYESMGVNAGKCAFAMLDAHGVVIAWHDLDDARMRDSRGILGRHVAQFYVPEDILGGHPERDLRAAALQGGSTAEGWHLRPAGDVFWGIRVIDSVVLRDGRLQGFSFVTRRASSPVANFARRDYVAVEDDHNGEGAYDAARSMPVRRLARSDCGSRMRAQA